MTIGRGDDFGHYRIGDCIGEGGMGQVFQATDTVLDRQVAIKVLPESFAADADRVARFEREAKTLATLNHPNIAQIYGLEKQGDTTAIVMELVEGPTLADRIAEGPLQPEEAMRIAKQIANALEAAHNRGVVHRDLKPANIKVTHDGQVKVLDFGIAKAMDLQGSSGGGSRTPTLITPAVTETGIILGTAAYMSPEQARGKFVDQRTDVWAFGCVLFEMLTGQPAFSGEDVAVVLARIIANESDLSTLPGSISPLVRHTIAMCLQKDPGKRIHHIGDVKLAMEGAFEIGVGSVTNVSRKSRWPVLAAGLLLGVGIVAGAWWLKPAAQSPPLYVTRFSIPVEQSVQLRNLAWKALDLSADGSRMVFNTTGGLILRNLADTAFRLLPGTEQNIAGISISPTGEWITYYDSQLKKIPATGGSPVVLLPNLTSPPQGSYWLPDESAFLIGYLNAVLQVPANGGEATRVIESDFEIWDPQLLPNGDILYSSGVQGEGQQIVIQTPGTDGRQVSFPGGRARYLPTGHLVYTDPGASPNALFARTLDLTTYALGGPVPIAENIAFQGSRTQFEVADSGTLLSLFGNNGNTSSGLLPELTLSIVDWEGNRQALDLPPQPYRSPRISPDGSQLAVEILGGGNESSIWVYDLSGDADIRRLTQVNEGINLRPTWTLDSQQLAFMSDRDGPGSIYLQPADGSRPAVRLTTATAGIRHMPESWSPDGALSFSELKEGNAATAWDVYVRSPDGEISLFHGLPESNQYSSSFSPDGQWLAYSSPEKETNVNDFRIFVERYPKTGERYEVAVGGAFTPVFSPDGSKLYYRRTTPRVINSVSILESDNRFRFSSAESISISDFQNHQNYRDWDPLPDGSGLVMLDAITQEQTDGLGGAGFQIDVVLNWFEEIKQRVQVQ